MGDAFFSFVCSSHRLSLSILFVVRSNFQSEKVIHAAPAYRLLRLHHSIAPLISGSDRWSNARFQRNFSIFSLDRDTNELLISSFDFDWPSAVRRRTVTSCSIARQRYQLSIQSTTVVSNTDDARTRRSTVWTFFWNISPDIQKERIIMKISSPLIHHLPGFSGIKLEFNALCSTNK